MITDTSSMDRPVAVTRPRRQTVLIAIAVAVVVIVALLFPAIRRWVRADRAVDASGLRVAPVTRGDLVRDLSVQARVIASLSPTLFAAGQGIVALKTIAGSQVKQGDVLATIDSKELRSALDQAQAQYLTSRAELDRQKIQARQTQLRAEQQAQLLTLRLSAAKRLLERVQRTFNEGLSNKADLELAQDNARIAQIELDQAQRELGLSRESSGFEMATREQQVRRQQSVVDELQKRVDDLTIRAPFDGMVATVAVQDRDAVAPNQAVLTIVNLSSLELEAGVPEEYGSETAIGTPAQIMFGGREYPGHVTAISPEVVNGELRGRIAFDGDRPEGLRQSQRLTARLTFESKKNVLKVARGAFLEEDAGRSAYVVDGKIATRRTIETGARSVNEVEIVKGLGEGEQVVISETGAFQRAQTVMLR